jgi:hypothetical protein
MLTTIPNQTTIVQCFTIIFNTYLANNNAFYYHPKYKTITLSQHSDEANYTIKCQILSNFRLRKRFALWRQFVPLLKIDCRLCKGCVFLNLGRSWR